MHRSFETGARIAGSRSHAPRGNAVLDALRRLPPPVGPRSGPDGIPTRSVGTSVSQAFQPLGKTVGPVFLPKSLDFLLIARFFRESLACNPRGRGET
jgi:hypothetical protein